MADVKDNCIKVTSGESIYTIHVQSQHLSYLACSREVVNDIVTNIDAICSVLIASKLVTTCDPYIEVRTDHTLAGSAAHYLYTNDDFATIEELSQAVEDLCDGIQTLTKDREALATAVLQLTNENNQLKKEFGFISTEGKGN